ncbi:MAG: hypothetical protein CMO01_27730 [Thalassobius sp.]|nr:hypothetical protein [Thalassovita sp.]
MKKTGKFIIFSSILLLMSFGAFAQSSDDEDEENPDKIPLIDRLYFGGNLGFQFGDITYIDVSPLVGYKITDKLSGGVGGTYRYLKNKIYYPAIESNILGYRFFGRYDITEVVYPYVEYENLSFSYGDESPRQWYDALFVGAGLFQPIGRRGGINLLVLYNLNYSATTAMNSIYNSPWVFRVGFQF